ncbi:MAG: hypothetical protein HQL79_10840 [Magnetococcales bacterium]|nr:hypothetical protein [Magnetococcales bacterium]
MTDEYGKVMLRTLDQSPRGRIILANVYHSLANGQLTEKHVADFFKACAEHFENDSGLGGDASADEIINMMVTVANARSDLRFLSNSKPCAVPDGKHVSTVIPWEKAVNYLFDPSRINALSLPVLHSEVDDLAVLELEEVTGASDMFARNAQVGSPESALFWVTLKEELDDVRRMCQRDNTPLADRIRDILGLPDRATGEVLLQFSLPGQFMVTTDYAAPTFIEAGGNSRFKARLAAGKKTVDNWGRTADLAKIWPDAKPGDDLDGVSEVVVARTPFSAGLGWNWRVIGKVGSFSEGRTESDNVTETATRDSHYANLIGDGVSFATLVDRLEKLMNHHTTT